MGKENIYMLPIETERLFLRRFILQDAADVRHFSSDPNIAIHLRGFPGQTLEEVEAYIRQQNAFEPGDLDCCFDLAVELKSEKKVIGLVTIIRHEAEQGEIGFVLNTAYQRRGYATEAVRGALDFGFNRLEFHRIYSSTSRLNISSWMLLERVGMRREAIFLQDHKENNEWHDSFIYAILKNEWPAKSNKIYE